MEFLSFVFHLIFYTVNCHYIESGICIKMWHGCCFSPIIMTFCVPSGLEWCWFPRIEADPDTKHWHSCLRWHYTEQLLRPANLYPDSQCPPDWTTPHTSRWTIIMSNISYFCVIFMSININKPKPLFLEYHNLKNDLPCVSSTGVTIRHMRQGPMDHPHPPSSFPETSAPNSHQVTFTENTPTQTNYQSPFNLHYVSK